MALNHDPRISFSSFAAIMQPPPNQADPRRSLLRSITHHLYISAMFSLCFKGRRVFPMVWVALTLCGCSITISSRSSGVSLIHSLASNILLSSSSGLGSHRSYQVQHLAEACDKLVAGIGAYIRRVKMETKQGCRKHSRSGSEEASGAENGGWTRSQNQRERLESDRVSSRNGPGRTDGDHL